MGVGGLGFGGGSNNALARGLEKSTSATLEPESRSDGSGSTGTLLSLNTASSFSGRMDHPTAAIEPTTIEAVAMFSSLRCRITFTFNSITLLGGGVNH